MPTIDSDAHVVESERTWDYMEKADQKYRPVIVKPRSGSNAEYWFIDGKIRGLVRVIMTAKEMAEVAQRTGRVMGTPQETREMENVPARLKHMDELGIDVQVLYPTMFIEQITEKPAWEVAICPLSVVERLGLTPHDNTHLPSGPAGFRRQADKGMDAETEHQTISAGAVT